MDSESDDSAADPYASDLATRKAVGLMRARLFGSDPPTLGGDRYTLLERVGEGGMGVVFAAWDRQLSDLHSRLAGLLLATEPAQALLHAEQALAVTPDPGETRQLLATNPEIAARATSDPAWRALLAPQAR